MLNDDVDNLKGTPLLILPKEGGEDGKRSVERDGEERKGMGRRWRRRKRDGGENEEGFAGGWREGGGGAA